MTKELATKEETKEVITFKLLEVGEDALAVIKNNLDGEPLNPRDIDRVGVPAGGGTQWCVPTLEGEINTPELTGVILAIKNCRAYWADDYSGGNTPPDCSSDDNVIGLGTPGGLCRDCPMSKFGSDSKGRGQACKQIKRVFLLPGDSLFPMIVQLPPTSLGGCGQYTTRLGSKYIDYRTVVTRITLAKEKNPDGIAYSKAVFAMKSRLDPARAERFIKHSEDLGLKPKRGTAGATTPSEAPAEN